MCLSTVPSVLNYATHARALCMRLPEAASGLALHPTGFMLALAHGDRIDLHHILRHAWNLVWHSEDASMHSMHPRTARRARQFKRWL